MEQGGAHVVCETSQRFVNRRPQRLPHPGAHTQHAFLDDGHQLGVGQFGGFREAVLVVLHGVVDVLLAGIVGDGLGDVALPGDDHPQGHGAVEGRIIGQSHQVVELVQVLAARLASEIEDEFINEKDDPGEAMRLGMTGKGGHAVGELVGVKLDALGAAGIAIGENLAGQFVTASSIAGRHLVEALAADAGGFLELLVDHIAVATGVGAEGGDDLVGVAELTGRQFQILQAGVGGVVAGGLETGCLTKHIDRDHQNGVLSQPLLVVLLDGVDNVMVLGPDGGLVLQDEAQDGHEV